MKPTKADTRRVEVVFMTQGEIRFTTSHVAYLERERQRQRQRQTDRQTDKV